jgi:hypothetical protein
MSKMTDRAFGQDLIALAKQKHEQRQRTSLPGNTVKLPSKGLTYPESSPLRSGEVDIRFMTAYDEDIITNGTYIRDNTVYERLLESIIITPGVDVSDICIGDRDAILVAARIFSYDSKYPVLIKEDGKDVIKQLDLTQIPHRPFDLVPDDNGEFDYVTESGEKLKFKFLTVTAVKDLINDENKVSSIIRAMLVEVDGTRSKAEIEEYIKYRLIAKENRKIQSYIAANMPGLVSDEIEFQGEDGDTFRYTFQVGLELFWV